MLTCEPQPFKLPIFRTDVLSSQHSSPELPHNSRVLVVSLAVFWAEWQTSLEMSEKYPLCHLKMSVPQAKFAIQRLFSGRSDLSMCLRAQRPPCGGFHSTRRISVPTVGPLLPVNHTIPPVESGDGHTSRTTQPARPSRLQ